MVAALLKLLSSGIQDERIAFQPDALRPFHRVWIRAGRFTTRWERLEFDSVPAFGQTANVRLLRKGHLVTRLYLVATMPDLYAVQQRARVANGGVYAYPRFGWTNSLGHALVQRLTLDIGNARVETMDSQLLEMIDEFYTPLEKVPVVNQLIKRLDTGFTDQAIGWPEVGNAARDVVQPYPETVVVPLPLWFGRGDPGTALPIDAIGGEEVRVGITLRGINGLYYTGSHITGNTSLEDGTSLFPMLGAMFYPADPSLVGGQTPLSDAGGGPIQMPLSMPLGECYVMAEYVYLDQNEANRFRLADLQVPVVQHAAAAPYDTRGLQNARVRLDFPNPTREILFSCSPVAAATYNAHFLTTRDLTGTVNTVPSGDRTPWWPDAVGLSFGPVMNTTLMRPAFALSDSEPLAGYALEYQGSLTRFRTEGCALFRSVLPSYELRKSPWHARYLYALPFGIQNGFTPISQTQGAANMDKIVTKELVLQFRPRYGAVSLEVGRFIVRVYAEAYNVLRVYGGRAGMLF